MAKRKSYRRSQSAPIITLALVALGFFLMVFLNAEAMAKILTLELVALVLIFGIIHFRKIKEQLSLPLLFLIAVVLMGCISTFYAIWGDYALRGATYLLTALCGPVVVWLIFAKDAAPERKLGIVLSSAVAFGSLVSIDMISTRLISTPVIGFLKLFVAHFSDITPVESGVRINGFIDMPNIFAGICGLGVLLSLGLAKSSQSKKERNFHLCCLYISALAFMLTFSMGATAAILLSFLVFLLLEKKENRGSLLVLMVKTLVLVLLGVLPISMTSLTADAAFRPIGLVCTAAGAALLCLADNYVLKNFGQKMNERKRLLPISVAAVCILLVGYIAAGLCWIGPAELSSGETLRRANYPTPGAYTLQMQGQGDVEVKVEYQNSQQTMMRTSTVLYQGPAAKAQFTVPEDSKVVYYNFTAKSDAVLEQVLCENGEVSLSVPLHYNLLPGFIANRLQGLLANQNAIQRTVFFRDGMKVFRQSPVVGNGLGAFEMAYSSVQEFYYETKYVHNHYIETLLETGVVGLCLFLGLLISSAVAIWRTRKKEDASPLLPALGSLLLFMTIHAGVEVVFSTGFYLPLAFGVFVLIHLCCGASLSLSRISARVRTWIPVGISAFLLVYGVLLCCNVCAKDMIEKTNTFDVYEKAIRLDVFDWETSANAYIRSMTEQEVPESVEQAAAEYAVRLQNVPCRWVHYRLSHYYFDLGQTEKALQSALTHIKLNASNSEKWNELYALLEKYEQSTDLFRSGTKEIYEYMTAWDAENMGSIELTEASQAFLQRVIHR